MNLMQKEKKKNLPDYEWGSDLQADKNEYKRADEGTGWIWVYDPTTL